MHIQSLELTNFQSHFHTKIDFDKELNVIFGESDQGKSSIIRALRFIFYNRPAGANFISNGETFTEISVVLDNGSKITRIKNLKGANRYILIVDNKKTSYDNFGTEVPEEIKEALGIDKARFDKNTSVELNLAQQLDPPFLLSETGSSGAKFIGKLSGIDLADNAIQDLNKDIRNIGIEKRNSESKIKELLYRLEAYKNLPAVKEEIEKIETLLREYKEISDKLTLLFKLNQQIISFKERESTNLWLLIKYKNIPDFIPIKEIKEKIENYKLLFIKYTTNKQQKEISEDSLRKLIDIPEFSPIEDSQIKLHKYSGFLKLYQINKERQNIISTFLKSHSDLPDTDRIEKDYLKLLTLKKIRDKKLILDKKKDDNSLDINNINYFFETAMKEYKTILEEAKICPLCGSNLSDNRIKSIIGEIYSSTKNN